MYKLPIALLCVFIASSEGRTSTPETQSFYVAVKPNPKGVAQLKRYILDHSSNPESDKYGAYLSATEIANMLRPHNLDLTMSYLREMGIECDEHGGTALRCIADTKLIDEYSGYPSSSVPHFKHDGHSLLKPS